MRGEEARRAKIVSEVVASEMARRGCRGLVLASPPGPEGDLLARWLGEELPLRRPDPGAVSDVAGALAVAGAPGSHVECLAWRTVAEAQALAQGLLPLGATNKTVLLLEDAPLPASVLPLGDLWSEELSGWEGGATLPTLLRGRSSEVVGRVEESLRSYLEEGVDPEQAFAGLGELAGQIRQALDASERRRRGLVVPKLTRWTVGTDLAR